MDFFYIPFLLFECFLFILPALPSEFYIRILILFGYFIAHTCKVQTYYLQIKKNILEKRVITGGENITLADDQTR